MRCGGHQRVDAARVQTDSCCMPGSLCRWAPSGIDDKVPRWISGGANGHRGSAVGDVGGGRGE